MLSWKEGAAPPQPSTSEDHWLAFDPKSSALWLLLRGHSSKDLGLWRAPVGEPFVRVAAGSDLGFPYEPYFGFLYFDEARGRLTFFGGSYNEEEPLLHALDGTRFAPIRAKDAARFGSYDGAAYDPARKVLLHFVHRDEDPRPPVRELHGDTWREPTRVPSDVTSQVNVTNGWDAERGKTIWVSPEDDVAWAWDGASWEKLAKLPKQSIYTTRLTTVDPKTKRLLVLHVPDDDPQDMCELGAKKWEAHENLPEARLSAAAWVPSERKTYFVADRGSVLVAFDGSKFTPVEPRTPDFVSRADAGAHVTLVHDGYTVAAYRPGALPQPIAKLRVRSWLPHGDDFLGITVRGEILLMNERGELKTLQRAPSGYTERDRSAIGWDAERKVLVVASGKADKRKLQETWESDLSKPLARARPKGKQPAEYDGFMTWHPGAGALVLASGVVDYNDTPSGKTWLYDGETWVGHPTKLDAAKPPPTTKLVAYDDRSGQLLLVRWQSEADECVLWIWQGGGKWTAAGKIQALPTKTKARWGGHGSAVAFDAAARKLVAFGPLDDGSGAAGVREVAIGAWLDSLPKPKLSAKAAAAAKQAAGARAATPPVGKKAFAFELAAKGDDLFGGAPPGIDATSWPSCRECKQPMPHVLTLHAHAERLPLKKHAAIALFCCDSGDCDSGEPGGGANAALLLDGKAVKRRPLAKPPAESMKPRRFAYRERFELDPVEENAPDPKLSNKVGGYPAWLQSPQTPACPKCKKDMTFVAELGARLDRALNFGDVGEGYLFVCPSEHAARFLWQCH